MARQKTDSTSSWAGTWLFFFFLFRSSFFYDCLYWALICNRHLFLFFFRSVATDTRRWATEAIHNPTRHCGWSILSRGLKLIVLPIYFTTAWPNDKVDYNDTRRARLANGEGEEEKNQNRHLVIKVWKLTCNGFVTSETLWCPIFFLLLKLFSFVARTLYNPTSLAF